MCIVYRLISFLTLHSYNNIILHLLFVPIISRLDSDEYFPRANLPKYVYLLKVRFILISMISSMTLGLRFFWSGVMGERGLVRCS